jgi:hypothetical protein
VVAGLLTGHNAVRTHLYIMLLTEEETSAHVLCECVALATLKTYRSGALVFLDLRMLEVKVWGKFGTFLRGQGSRDLDISLRGKKVLPQKGLHAPGPRGIKPINYSFLFPLLEAWIKM